MIELLNKLKDAEDLVKSIHNEILEYKFKFRQLKPGMIYLIQGGWDDYFEHEIISVDYDNYTFEYQDLSMIKWDLKTYKSSKIPYDLYETRNDLKYNKKFIFDMVAYEREEKLNKILR